MYVKNEPDCDFDMTMEMVTDMETSLMREELFGNHCIPSGKFVFSPPTQYAVIDCIKTFL